MLVENFFENLQVLHLNTMENRAYFIPVSEGHAPTKSREESDRLPPSQRGVGFPLL